MERVRGKMIASRWHSLSDTAITPIFSQLKQMIEELRSIPYKTNAVSNVDGGPIYDVRLPDTPLWGPFESIHDFHLALRNGITAQHSKDHHHNPSDPGSISDVTVAEMRKLIAFHDSASRTPVFTHGDLSSLNILIRDDKVVGIIDWETAGWLPYYWEYTRAWNLNFRNTWWQAEVHKFSVPLPEELSMEKIRREYYGDVAEASVEWATYLGSS